MNNQCSLFGNGEAAFFDRYMNPFNAANFQPLGNFVLKVILPRGHPIYKQWGILRSTNFCLNEWRLFFRDYYRKTKVG